MGFVDVHCHVLPGIDDGSRNMDMTMEMLRIAAKNNITEMIVTPHYKKGHVGTPRNVIGDMIRDLEREAEAEGLSINFYPGTEIAYNSSLEEKLESGWLARMNDTDYVLVEFSPFETFSYIKNAIDDIFSMGYRPIIAHVERYQCMLAKLDNVRVIHDMGCQVQVNAGSVAGNYGFRVKHFISKLLKEQLIEYVGTDAHNADSRKPEMLKCAEVIYKKCSTDYADAVLFGNAWDYLLTTE